MDQNTAKTIFEECQNIGPAEWNTFFAECQKDPLYPKEAATVTCPSSWLIRTLTDDELETVRKLFIFEYNVLRWRERRGIVSHSDAAEFGFVGEMLSHIEDERARR